MLLMEFGPQDPRLSRTSEQYVMIFSVEDLEKIARHGVAGCSVDSTPPTRPDKGPQNRSDGNISKVPHRDWSANRLFVSPSLQFAV